MRVLRVARKQRDFNADMGAYLDRRKGSAQSGSFNFFNTDSFFSKKSSTKSIPDFDSVETTVIEEQPTKKKSWFSFLFGSGKQPEDVDMDDLPEEVRTEVEEVEQDIEEIDHEVEELEKKRTGLFARLFGALRKKPEPLEDGDLDPEVVASAIGEHGRNEALISDTRVVLKDLHKWLGRLPPEQIDAFKRSPDFNRYKDLLEAYGLVR